MFVLTFYCPKCNGVQDGEIDTLALLFAQKSIVKCSNCETQYNAKIEHGAIGSNVSLQGEIEPDTEEY